MATPVELPQLGNTVEECVIAKWRRRPGDVVVAGDVVADIETDKTTFEVTAPVAGTVLAIFFEEGALVPVFTNILVIGDQGESVEPFRPVGTSAVESGPVQQAPQAATPAQGGRRSPAGPATAASFSPRASRFAALHGFHFHPASLAGSGPGGRVLERDIQRAYQMATSAPAASPRIEEPSRSAAPAGATDTAATGLRGTIARRMRESLASTAQYTLHASADASGLLAARARIKERAASGGPDITIGDLVAFCAIRALLDVPDLNAAFADGRIVRHRDVHLAFAVDTPRGLLAPVVRDAHALSIAGLAARTKELAAQAVHGTIPADDLTGGTFTISNLGALGIESFTPLLNPPQVAILGVGAIRPRVVRKDGPRDTVRVRETSARRAMALAGSVEFVDSIGLSLTCDHQVIDGAPGARFLQVLRAQIEAIDKVV
jgi:pyruvate dehydrogenase E2 component (dihydrolipoamide acetyltransferase)